MDNEYEPLFPDSSISSSANRPGLFELLAQEQLRDLLHPVVRYVLSYLTQHYPRYFLRILNRHEEFFAALLLVIEHHHLTKHNASLSEHFYGLRLLSTSGISTPRLDALQQGRRQRDLTRRQRWILLLFLVGLPYLRARAQDYYETLGGASDSAHQEGEAPGTAVTTTQKLFKMIYPYANLSLDITLLGYDIAYLFDRTKWYRPWHRLAGVTISRRGPDDEEDLTSSRSLLSRLPPLLPPLLLALKLSQWWYSPSSPRTLASPNTTTSSAIHAKILPPRPLAILPSSGLLTPPETPPLETSSLDNEKSISISPTTVEDISSDPEEKPVAQGYTIGKDQYGKCPLCNRKWQNPAILPSGWVVCWRCGWDAIEGEEEEEDDGEGASGDQEEVGQAVQDIPGQLDNGMANVNGNVNGFGNGHVQRRGWRKGKCPITGMDVALGELRRVLV